MIKGRTSSLAANSGRVRTAARTPVALSFSGIDTRFLPNFDAVARASYDERAAGAGARRLSLGLAARIDMSGKP
jgi:hypothetical protein